MYPVRINWSKRLEQLKKQLSAIEQHKKTDDHQKAQLKNEIDQLKVNECIVIIDFKENLRIGGGPEETKKEYFEQSFISDLGAAVITKENGNIAKSYYNFFSEILTHDSLYSGDCIKELFSRNEMKRYKNVSIWSDGGKHFKSKEFLARVFENVHKTLKINIKVNFFAEYHGKNIVDGHFGTISKWLKECLTHKEIKTIDGLIASFKDLKKEAIIIL